MKPRTGESVTYVQCTLTQPATLPCHGGPNDGEWRTVSPLQCMGDLVAVWDRAGERCDVYQTVLRFTKRHGSEGVVLRWVP